MENNFFVHFMQNQTPSKKKKQREKSLQMPSGHDKNHYSQLYSSTSRISEAYDASRKCLYLDV